MSKVIPIPKRKSKADVSVPAPSIDSMVSEYHALRTQSKTIKSRMDALAKTIKDHASKFGVKDDKGSFYCENDGFIFGNQARKSVSLNEVSTLSYLKENRLTRAIKKVEMIDIEAFERLVAEGKIPFEDVEALSDVKITYAIDIREKDEMGEVNSYDFAANRRG